GAGLVWTVTTFLVVPVLAAEGVGPIEAIGRSAALLRKSWGENLIGSAGISLVISLLTVLVMIVGVGGGILSLDRGEVILGVVLIAGAAVLLLAIVLIGAALSAVYQA